MHRRIWLLAVPLALASLSGTMAHGKGTRTAVEARIYTPTGTTDLAGEGALGTVRNDPPTGIPLDKSIGCWVDAVPGSAIVWCRVITPTEELHCWSDNPVLIATAATLKGDSLLRFTTHPSAPDPTLCIAITVDNNSMYAPKVVQ